MDIGVHNYSNFHVHVQLEVRITYFHSFLVGVEVQQSGQKINLFALPKPRPIIYIDMDGTSR